MSNSKSRATGIIFLTKKDGSDSFIASSFTLLWARVKNRNEFFTQGHGRAFFVLSAFTALSSFTFISHLLLMELKSIALTTQKDTVLVNYCVVSKKEKVRSERACENRPIAAVLPLQTENLKFAGL